VFANKQISRILPQTVEALVAGDPDEARTWADELEISSAKNRQELSSRDLCDETLRLLNSEAQAGRLQARTILTQMLLNPVNIDESGEMVSSLLKTWREDLISSLRDGAGIKEIVLRGDAIEIIPEKGQRDTVLRHVTQVVASELEHADWLVSLITSRAALYRADLEEIVVALSDFCAQRSECSILLRGEPPPFLKRLGPHKLSMIEEDEFLVEILEAIEGHLGDLSRERLPESVTDIVEQQILYPSEAPINYERLASLVLETEPLRATYPESETLSKEELTDEIKSRAERLMRIIERESFVLYERATYKDKRCAALARISPYCSSTEAQLAKMVAETRDKLSFFARDEDALRFHVERFRDNLYELGGKLVDTWRIRHPQVFTLFIPGEDTQKGEDLLCVCRVCMTEYEEPDIALEMMSEALSSEDVDHASGLPFEEEADDSPNEYDEADYLDEETNLGEPLTFSLSVLRPLEGDLLSEGEKLALWLARLEEAYTPLSTEACESRQGEREESEEHSEVSASQWRYYGLSHTRCERLFRPYFSFIANRYGHAWSILPPESQEERSLIDIAFMSPLQQMIDVLELIEEHNIEVAQLTETQRENVRDWLRSYAEWWDAPTTDLLFSVPLWTRAAKLLKECDQSPWVVEEREELLDTHLAFLDNRLFSPEIHLLLQSTSERGMNTLLELLEDGLIFVDGVSEAFVACINTIPAAELKKRIHHRAKPALKKGVLSSFWEPIGDEYARESQLALRTHFGSMWVDIHRSFTRGLL
jgi:hypothetical protein